MADDATMLAIAELRRQVVFFKISAAASIDTKAAGLIAATFALFALVVPRVVLTDGTRGVAAIAFGLALGVLVWLAMAIRPRVGGFSHGPGADAMLEVLHTDPGELAGEVAVSYGRVRDKNSRAVDAKADALNGAIVLMIATIVGMAALVVVGGIS